MAMIRRGIPGSPAPPDRCPLTLASSPCGPMASPAPATERLPAVLVRLGCAAVSLGKMPTRRQPLPRYTGSLPSF
jgi:hypothetical protein